MTANLKTTEVIEAVIDLVNGGPLSFTPKLVQEGDLGFWVERQDLAADLPAVLVECGDIDPDPWLTGDQWDVVYPIRVLLIDTWDFDQVVRDLQKQRAEEIAQLFIGSSGSAFDLGGASISGLQVLQAILGRVEFEPPESVLMSQDEGRRVFAVAVNVEITTLTARV